MTVSKARRRPIKEQASAAGGGTAPPTTQATNQLRSNQAKSKEKISDRGGSRFSILSDQCEEQVEVPITVENLNYQGSKSMEIATNKRDSCKTMEARIMVEQSQGKTAKDSGKVWVAASNEKLLEKIRLIRGATSAEKNGETKKEGANKASDTGPLKDITNLMGRMPNKVVDVTVSLPSDVTMDGRPDEAHVNKSCATGNPNKDGPDLMSTPGRLTGVRPKRVNKLTPPLP